jgi:ADP-ribosylation factor GTPase-activating protein 1
MADIVDKWSDVQAKRMSLGGNQNAIAYFQTHPDYRENMPIVDKYNSEFAAFYKEKLVAICDGTEWVQPAIGSRKKAKSISSSNKNNEPRSLGNNSFAAGSNSGANINRLSSNSNGNMSQKQRNEDYFSKKGEENNSRPEDVAPSKGGKYSGFGNPDFADSPPRNDNKMPDDLLENPMETLSKGWSMFASFAAQGAKVRLT